MKDAMVNEFSRPFSLDKLPLNGADVVITTDADDRVALARRLKVPEIGSFSAHLHVSGDSDKARVQGEVTAEVVQECGVTLELFSQTVTEPVDVVFVSDKTLADGAADPVDEPDRIVNGRIDLGALAAEFLALGIDPFPRKPGAVFSYTEDNSQESSPFSGLETLKNM
ncbi:MAG: DUF177 domain-containing protein [Methylobacteriaceae bacterium]|nr:DUF177 domain-containing protein [Methylobacteriaceae bacterium]